MSKNLPSLSTLTCFRKKIYIWTLPKIRSPSCNVPSRYCSSQLSHAKIEFEIFIKNLIAFISVHSETKI